MNLPQFHSTDAARNRNGWHGPLAREGGLPARPVRAFTLIEIAIAIGVIGFALVAIMGILPFGLEVQRDNRSETIINQDATFWLETIRSGARGIPDLPDYVTQIVISNRTTGVEESFSGFSGCSNIVGLLTTSAVDTNLTVRAYVTAFSGSAAEKDPVAANRDLAFSYIMRVLFEPATNTTVSFSELSFQNEPLASLYELRLTFAYPFVRTDRNPPRSQMFRALVNRGGDAITTNFIAGREYYFLTPE